jgi:predicted nucleic acid-binding protein
VIAYFDTSAIIPLLVADEHGAEAALSAWVGAESVVTARILYAEAAAALAAAARLDRLEAGALDQALGQLDALWAQMDVVSIDDPLVRAAGSLARTHALRGYDAVHCAAALRLADPTTVALSGDRQLLDAWRAEGLHVVDTRA